METLSFVAKVAHASQEDDCYVVGFADDEFEPDNYILLQRTLKFNVQDIKLGMDGEYVEINSRENSGYKCVKSALFDNERFVLNLKSKIDGINRVAVDLRQVKFDAVKTVEFLLEVLPDKIHFL